MTTTLPASSISQSYLKKLGILEEIQPDLENLKMLLSRHLENIPFGNLASFSGNDVSLSPPDLAHKLLHQRREGYCLEQSTLTRIVLTELGYKAYNVLGRVYYQNSGIQTAPIRTHLTTIVELEGHAFLFDPGFGGMTPTGVLAIDDTGQPQVTPLESFRFIAVEQSGIQQIALTEMKIMLQAYVHHEWMNIYAINPEQEISESDILLANWYISTSPLSVFTQHLMLAAVDSEQRITLKDNLLRIHGKNASSKKLLETQQDFENVLESVFRIDLSQVDSEGIFRKIQQLTENKA